MLCFECLIEILTETFIYCWPGFSEDCYEKAKLRTIRSDHLYHTLHHPTVIGHMGNIVEYQENSLEGIKSLIRIEAGGVHMHVQLTKDDKLILFQDANLHVREAVLFCFMDEFAKHALKTGLKTESLLDLLLIFS